MSCPSWLENLEPGEGVSHILTAYKLRCDDAYAAGQGVEQAASAAGDGASAAPASPWHAVDDGEGNTCVGAVARRHVPCCMTHAACLCVIQVLLQRSDWREQLGAAPRF